MNNHGYALHHTANQPTELEEELLDIMGDPSLKAFQRTHEIYHTVKKFRKYLRKVGPHDDDESDGKEDEEEEDEEEEEEEEGSEDDDDDEDDESPENENTPERPRIDIYNR
jgi:hypothetical protein